MIELFFVSATNSLLSTMFLVISYLVGSIPFGVILGKAIKGIDIRKHGSKNIGSTNAIRVLGKPTGFLVFFFDVFKGMLVIIILKTLDACHIWTTPIEYVYYGVAAIIGHSFSIFLNFKGGKAVATSLGVVLILTPIPAVLCLIMFGIFFYTTGYVSLASTFATLTVVISGWVLYAIGIQSTTFLDYFVSSPGLIVCCLYSIVACLIMYKHITNYKRLANGTEHSFKKKKLEEKKEN